MSDIKDQINHFETIKAEAQVEIDKLEKLCQHQNYSIAWWMNRPGSTYPAKICDFCHSNIGAPTEKEKLTFELDEQKRQIQFLKDTYGEKEAKRLMVTMGIKE